MSYDSVLFDEEFELKPQLEEKKYKSSCEGCSGLLLNTENGQVSAKSCDCQIDKFDIYKRLSNRINQAQIPARYITAHESELREDLAGWVDSLADKKSTAFLYGLTGVGKTHSAISALFKLLEHDSGLYIPLYKLLETRREYLDHRYEDDKQVKTHYKEAYNHLVHKVKNIPVLVLDEMAQEKLKYDERSMVFGIIDHRYSSDLTTILISNHCNDRQKSLENKTLDQLVGKRISSRIESAEHFHFVGNDKRLQEGSQSISKEQIDSFIMPAKILTHDNDTHQIMTWLARNPAFRTVSKQERNSLTIVQGQLEIDADRPSPDVFRDVWSNGDMLILKGPVCDHEDKKLYGSLIKILADQHKASVLGLDIELSFSKVLKNQGKVLSGKNIQTLRRQLSRLTQMSLEFTNKKGNKWSGPLLTELKEFGSSSDRRVNIHFSHFMVAFYQAHSYVCFNSEIAQKLVGDESGFYVFFMSHNREKKIYPIPLEKCQKLLGMPKGISRKSALRRISKSTKSLIDYGILSPETKFLKDSLYPVLS